LQVDGKISANGGTAVSNINSGGGAGGSVWISAKTLSGSGTIAADGAAANGTGGGGGGGRVAIWADNTNSFSGIISARGGAGANYGGAGTIYLNSSSLGNGPSPKLLVDNGGSHGTN